jgi:hypothetical protein
LVSKVPHLMHLLLHLLQSSQDLARQMSSLLVSLVIQILDRIGLHRMIMPRRMINRRQGLKLLRTPFFSFLIIVDKGGEELD